MRIVFIINSLGGGGVERVIETLADKIAREGQSTLDIILIDGKGRAAYQLPSSVNIHFLNCGSLFRGPFRLLGLPIIAAELAFRLKRIRPDGAISFLTRANLAHVLTKFFGWKGKITLSERTVTDIFYPPTSLQNRILRRLIKLLYSKADLIIAISEGVKRGLQRMDIDGPNIEVIHNPQRISWIRQRAMEPSGDTNLKSDSSKFTVVSCARLIPEKDFPTLLKSFALASKEIELRLLIIGDGPIRTELEELASELGITSMVEWAGWLENPFARYKTCHLFVATSQVEGFGNVLVEAMACGLPVICTDCESGPREILDYGKYGVLVPVGDIQTLANQMIRLASDPALLQENSRLAFERADQFDVSRILPRYLKTIEPKNIDRINAK